MSSLVTGLPWSEENWRVEGGQNLMKQDPGIGHLGFAQCLCLDVAGAIGVEIEAG